MAVGGDIIEITFNHPTIGTGVFFPKSGEDSKYDTGGFRSDDDASGIDGGGNMIDKMNRVRPSFEVVISNDQNTKQDLEKLVQLASSPVPASWTFSIVNGTVYGMKGKPVGDIQGEINNATVPLKVSGGGVAKKIVG